MPTRERYDPSTPGTRQLVDEIVHGTFVKEGTLLAFPTCFPGASVPITPDEGRITAPDITGDGAVYGGTSGHASHLFVGMFHGLTGCVLDMGVVDGADRCPAICCGTTRFVAAVNGPTGGRLVGCGLQPLPFDLIQEWGFGRQAYGDLGGVGDGERIVHMAAHPDRSLALGTSERHLFAVGLDDGQVEVLAEVTGNGLLAADASGAFLGRDGARRLWHYDATAERLDRQAVPLPPGSWEGVALRWGRDPSDGEVRDLGVAASVLERRRYGYSFGAAIVGRDGEIVFGEDDDLGHLWLYFPRIAPR